MPDKPANTSLGNASLTYSTSAWDEDAFAMYAEGRDPQACPVCARVGFFGPRVVGVSKLRACRFCGFHQEAEEPPTRAIPTVHACDEWPDIARAPYIWWVPPGETSYTCAFCRSVVNVAEHTVTPPSEDQNHPWWRVPQGRTRFYYARFWENWPFTKGRVFL